MTGPSGKAHQIATTAIQHIVHESMAADLDWKDVLIALETVLVIGVCYVAKTEALPGREERWAKEMLDALTESAHGGILEGLRREL